MFSKLLFVGLIATVAAESTADVGESVDAHGGVDPDACERSACEEYFPGLPDGDCCSEKNAAFCKDGYDLTFKVGGIPGLTPSCPKPHGQTCCQRNGAATSGNSAAVSAQYESLGPDPAYCSWGFCQAGGYHARAGIESSLSITPNVKQEDFEIYTQCHSSKAACDGEICKALRPYEAIDMPTKWCDEGASEDVSSADWLYQWAAATAFGASGESTGDFCSWSQCAEGHSGRVQSQLHDFCHESQSTCEGMCSILMAGTWCSASTDLDTEGSGNNSGVESTADSTDSGVGNNDSSNAAGSTSTKTFASMSATIVAIAIALLF